MTIIKEKSSLGMADLLACVDAGDELIITQDGKPVARLEPIALPVTPRVPGMDAGKFTVPPEFFEPLPPEMEDEFYK